VNPVSGERDLDIPGELRKRFGHKDLGIYLIARSNGRVRVGDRVTLPRSLELASPPAAAPLPVPSQASYICRGCYLIYDNESRPLPFAELDEAWPCPDCGTNKAQFRPYWSALTPAPEQAE
jgi:rubredoxin